MTRVNKTHGFTLVELLSVIAIIAILTAFAVPAIRAHIRDTKYAATMKQVETSEVAVASLVKKLSGPGYPPLTESTNIAAFSMIGTVGGVADDVFSKASILDNVLLAEGLLSKPLDIPFGTPNRPGRWELLWAPDSNAFYTNGDAATNRDYTNTNRLECQLTTSAAPSAATGANFWLSADTSATGNLPPNSRVVSLIIVGIAATDAAELANRYNNNRNATATAANNNGRVVYPAPDANTGLTTAYIYIAHY